MAEPTSDPGDDARVVLITAPDMEVGRGLARGLVDRRLAACVNIVPSILSIYRWEGELHEDGEVLLVAKTCVMRVQAVEEFLGAEHPYDVPECVAIRPARVEARYGAWLAAEVGGEAS